MHHTLPAVLLMGLGLSGIAAAIILTRRVFAPRSCGDETHPHAFVRTIRGEAVVACYPTDTLLELEYRVARWMQDNGRTSTYALTGHPLDERVKL